MAGEHKSPLKPGAYKVFSFFHRKNQSLHGEYTRATLLIVIFLFRKVREI